MTTPKTDPEDAYNVPKSEQVDVDPELDNDPVDLTDIDECEYIDLTVPEEK